MKRILLPAGGAILATGLLAAGLAGTASASGEIIDTPLTPNNKVAETVDFWFKANGAALRAASYYRFDYKEVDKLKTAGGYTADTKPGSTAPIGEEKKVTAKVQNVNLPKTIGKVFFEGVDGKLYWCSATSIQAKYRNLVATAGHCVFQTKQNGAVLDKWVFVPGYYQGRAPWGIYVGKQAFTHYDFANYEDYDRDYAFVTVYNGINLNFSKVEGKQVLKSEYDAYEGKKEVKSTELKDIPGGKTAEQQYKEGLDQYGPNGGFRSENVTSKEPAGGNFEDSVPTVDEVEVTELQYNNAPAPSESPSGWKNGDKGAVKDTPLTEAQYKKLLDEKAAGKVKGKVFIDDLGDYWLRQFYVIQWYKVSSATKYYHDSFFIYTGGDLTVKDAGRLGDNVGGQGFAWNQPTGKYVRTFGYPGGEHPDGSKPYTGVTPKWCYGKTSSKVNVYAPLKAEELVALKCAVTPGYNGSAWLLKYSNAKRLGYVNGVTTAVFGDSDSNNRNDTIYSSYFDGETAMVYKAAANLWSGKMS
ncbi:hypothetical protein OHA25_20025 [Nonomuraea sp. NBC_00507]|uniref:trypsin-like serine peptidase n=1 Tax=Nonomuraea sp. NBC_00507 TaxID=2976002 RepID=UPI002E171978